MLMVEKKMEDEVKKMVKVKSNQTHGGSGEMSEKGFLETDMKEMIDESKEKILKKEEILKDDDPLMKPFKLGWTREVVRRIITKNKAPNCDIYYFTPSKKKIRSLIEVKYNLTDGLSPECFSFKRQLLGCSSAYETVRDARVRKKNHSSAKSTKGSRKTDKTENVNKENSDQKIKVEVSTKENEEKKSQAEGNEDKENKFIKEEPVEENSKPKRKSKCQVEKEKRRLSSRMKKKKIIEEMPSPKRRKEVLKKIIRAKQAKQAKVVAGKKILKKIVRRKKPATPIKKIKKSSKEKETALKNKQSKLKNKVILKNNKKNNRVKNGENVKEGLSEIEKDIKSIASDLKSIVKKNIGKYREMREKQKLGVIKNQVRNQNRRIVVGTQKRSRSAPISKNKLFYLKPLERGWRRELVFRTNCSKAGQQADVYYFHPSGKKLRSCREIAENLTHGLSLECFTFRKEPIGCGEPSEVVRNARSLKNFSAS